jgi:hypothetical protein
MLLSMFSCGKILEHGNKKKAFANKLEGIRLLDWKQVAKMQPFGDKL